MARLLVALASLIVVSAAPASAPAVAPGLSAVVAPATYTYDVAHGRYDAPSQHLAGSVLRLEAYTAGRSAVGCGPTLQAGGFLAAEEGAATVRVGRWMGKDELKAMQDSGRVQEGAGGRTYVVHPPDPASYTGSAPGTIFAGFDVEASALRPAGNPLRRRIIGPNVQTRMFGPPPAEMPTATNICPICTK